MDPELSTTSMTFGVTLVAMKSGVSATVTAWPAWLSVSSMPPRKADIRVRFELSIFCLQPDLCGLQSQRLKVVCSVTVALPLTPTPREVTR